MEIARQVLDHLREEFRRAGHGSMRRVSIEIGLEPDQLATLINRGYMDVGILFAALEQLGIDPVLFVIRAVKKREDSPPPVATLPENRQPATTGAPKCPVMSTLSVWL